MLPKARGASISPRARNSTPAERARPVRTKTPSFFPRLDFVRMWLRPVSGIRSTIRGRTIGRQGRRQRIVRRAMESDVLLEVCLEDPSAVRCAEEGGAGRVELCSALAVGGLAPSVEAMQLAREMTRLPIMAMVRARAGDFRCRGAELRSMGQQIERARRAGMNGIVTGCLLADGSIDRAQLEELVTLADGLPVTFHRAFDHAPDAIAALELLVELGVSRVLTSGGAATAPAGAERLAQLVRRGAGRIVVMPGGGVRSDNAAELRRQTAAHEFHSSVTAIQPLGASAVRRLVQSLGGLG